MGKQEAGSFSLSGDAGNFLGIDATERRRLFYAGNWPEPFCTDFAATDKPEERAAVAAALIDHLIAEHERKIA